MDKAIMIEVENLRRASVTGLKKGIGNCFSKRRDRAIASIFFGRSSGACRLWQKGSFPSVLVRERGKLRMTLIYESSHRGISLALAASRLRSFHPIKAKR